MEAALRHRHPTSNGQCSSVGLRIQFMMHAVNTDRPIDMDPADGRSDTVRGCPPTFSPASAEQRIAQAATRGAAAWKPLGPRCTEFVRV